MFYKNPNKIQNKCTRYFIFYCMLKELFSEPPDTLSSTVLVLPSQDHKCMNKTNLIHPQLLCLRIIFWNCMTAQVYSSSILNFNLKVKCISWSLSGRGQDICALFETAYLRINLFLLIINLDYSRHLKRGNNIITKTVKQQGGTKEFTAQAG